MHGDSEEIVCASKLGQQFMERERERERERKSGRVALALALELDRRAKTRQASRLDTTRYRAMMNVPRDGQTKTNGLQQKKLSSNAAVAVVP